MLEHIALQNFRNHARLEIEFSPGVTVIWGPNGRGKSNVLRAIRWVAMNAPAGDGMVRRGAKGAVALLGVDGRTVKRRRGPGVNDYHLDGQVFVSFGVGGVPAPVAGALQLGEQNFQRQHDPAFWLGLTPGGLARELNAVFDLDVIDTSIANATRAEKAAAANAEAAAKELQEARAEVEKLAWVEAAAAAYARVEQLEEEMDRAATIAVGLAGRRGNLVKYTRDAKKLRQKADAAAGLAEAARAAGKAGQAAAALRGLCAAIAAAQKAARRPPDFAAVEAAYTKWKSAEAAAQALAGARAALRHRVGMRDTARAEEEQARRKYHDGTGGVCPLCGGPLIEGSGNAFRHDHLPR